MDNKPVNILSTFPLKKSEVERNCNNNNGRFVKKMINYSSVVLAYNKAVSGTDQFGSNFDHSR